MLLRPQKQLILAIAISLGTAANSLHAVPPSMANPRSVPAGKIVSFPVDPFMTAEQEAKLFAMLERPQTVNWSETTLQQVADELASNFPIVVNKRALEVMGLTIDMPVSLPPSPHPLPLGTQLGTLLESVDLTYCISGGLIIITTTDDAEDPSKASIRIYDVTPIVLRKDLDGKTVTDFESLMDAIETAIAPDSWEALGGPATMSQQVVRDRAMLSIAQTTMTHLLVQSYLDQANQFVPTDPGDEIPWRQNLPKGMMNFYRPPATPQEAVPTPPLR